MKAPSQLSNLVLKQIASFLHSPSIPNLIGAHSSFIDSKTFLLTALPQRAYSLPRRGKAPSNVKLDASSTSPATPIAITTATFKSASYP